MLWDWGNGCKYCEEFYKKGVLTNVKSFLEKLNKGGDVLIDEDIDEEGHEDQDEDMIIPEINLELDLNRKLELVNEWWTLFIYRIVFLYLILFICYLYILYHSYFL